MLSYIRPLCPLYLSNTKMGFMANDWFWTDNHRSLLFKPVFRTFLTGRLFGIFMETYQSILTKMSRVPELADVEMFQLNWVKYRQNHWGFALILVSLLRSQWLSIGMMCDSMTEIFETCSHWGTVWRSVKDVCGCEFIIEMIGLRRITSNSQHIKLFEFNLKNMKPKGEDDIKTIWFDWN
jgi:hypothetical protein